MEDDHWEILLERIREQKCTPFLGAGAAAGTLPLGSEIAEGWSREHDYPLEDPHDLARVAQFLAVKLDAMAPKEKIRRLLADAGTPDFAEAGEPHAVLAALALPLYLTTNFDGFMTAALARAARSRGRSSAAGTNACRRGRRCSTRLRATGRAWMSLSCTTCTATWTLSSRSS